MSVSLTPAPLPLAGAGRAPGRDHLLEVAQRGGIPADAADATLDRLLAGVADLPALAAGLPIRTRRLAEIRSMLSADWQQVAG